MAKPRSRSGITFPFRFEKNGRLGRIKKWSGGKFGTYFQFAGRKHRNSFRTFEAAFEYLDREFSKLDTDRANSAALHPVNHDIKTYHELEQLLRERGNGATLRETVEFFLAHHEHKRFSPRTVTECIASFLAEEESRNLSETHNITLTRHLGHFKKEFGSRKIHEIIAIEISRWLASRKSDDAQPWSAKTRRNVRGSLVSMSLYAQRILNAIPDLGETEFQKVKNPKRDPKGAVEIYTPSQITELLSTAVENDVDLLPAIIVGCFEGLRPDEFHAENADRPPLRWEAFNWHDKLLHVAGQKVRSKQTRDIPLHLATQAWLKPFSELTGNIWRYTKSYTHKMRELCEKAEVARVFDGFRHSYASYRIRHLKGDLAQLAAEMGNSPAEIVNSYKRNVTDAEADKWFSIMPPTSYAKKMKRALSSRVGSGMISQG